MTAPPRPVALVTGAARRVGAQVARTLHAAGYDLSLHYRHSGEAMGALCSELDATRARGTLALAGDLDDPAVPADLVARTLAHYGRLDVLVNNASAFQPTPIGSTTAAQWDVLFSSNARAPFFLAQAAAPALRAARGSIVNLADIYAERPLAGHTVYCMAKAALVMLTLSLAKELATKGIIVNAVTPAVIATEILQQLTDEHIAYMTARIPMGRVGQPEEVAALVVFLCSDDVTFSTGAVFDISGGRATY